EEYEVEMFCIGTEYRISSVKREKFWRALIAEVRECYNGKLTYSSNWDSYHQIPFWDALDYVGISSYFPLTESRTPSETELIDAWQPWLGQMRDFHRKVDQPIIFTEFGYLSVDGSAGKTWELEKMVKSLPVNELAQAIAIHSLFEVFWDEPWWHGGFLWKWFPHMSGHEGYPERDYTPQGKVAEITLKEWYGK
ncbi:MAG: hypothetical protein R3350_08665, partial [Saprospiraceae bacterium]|nr:hypothetical protein [Saprospiraceae bacterium]